MGCTDKIKSFIRTLRMLIIMAAFILITGFCTEPCLAESYNEIDGGTLSYAYSLEMWHYSGGYWKVGDYLTISDLDMDSRGYQSVLADSPVELSLQLPSAVKSIIAAAEAAEATLPAVSVTVSGKDLPAGALYSDYSCEIKNGKLLFSGLPKFNLIPEIELSLEDYGISTSPVLPLVDKLYGYNVYSIFGSAGGESYSAARASGWLDSDEPFSLSGMPDGRLHPSYIASNTGKLNPGYYIELNGESAATDNLTIGQGTFSKAGAAGVCFVFSMEFTFYEISYEEYPSKPENPTDPTEPTDPTDPTEESAKSGISELNAELNLPSYTYEGHSVTAKDKSSFTLETSDPATGKNTSENLSAAKAYSKGYAKSSYTLTTDSGGSASGLGTVSKTQADEAELKFSQAGNYKLRLKVKAASGLTDSDTKAIEVRSTPYAEAVLGGIQKENRRQTLDVEIAQNPDYPVSSYSIEIKDISSQAAEGSPAKICRRTVADTGSDDEFLRLNLEFLTKNNEDRQFKYIVTAVDSRGRTSSSAAVFTVKADRAPEGNISLKSSYLRESGSNTASISAEDISSSDGDSLERKWYIKNSGGTYSDLSSVQGYKDSSFGSGESISFNKNGVGSFTLMLELKDVWTEETLPEFITENDYLTSRAFATSFVDNIAPEVSLSINKTEGLELLLLAENEEEEILLNSKSSDIKTQLIKNRLQGSITIARLPNGSSNGECSYTGSVNVPFGFQGSWLDFWEEGCTAADENNIYKAEASWPSGTTINCYPSQPYIIRAFSRTDLQEKWHYTVSQDILAAAGYGADALLVCDGSGKYVYYIHNGKTLVLSSATGQLLTVLNYSLGKLNYLGEDYIYSFEADGIYGISLSDGSRVTIKETDIITGGITDYSPESALRFCKGKVNFLCKKQCGMYRGSLDTQSGSISFSILQGSEEDLPGLTSYLVGMDSRGNIIVNTAGLIRVWAYSGEMVKSFDFGSGYASGDKIRPVFDGTGRINYLYTALDSRDSSVYYCTCYVRGIYNGYSGNAAASDKYGYPCNSDHYVFGAELSSGKLSIALGGTWTFLANATYNNGPSHGLPERLKCYYFNPSSGVSSCGSGSGFISGLSNTGEYGKMYQGLIAVDTGDNNQTQSGAEHRTELIAFSESNASAKERLSCKYMAYEQDYSLVIAVNDILGSSFTGSSAQIKVIADAAAGLCGEGYVSLYTVGDLEKSFSLNAGRKYYYEYDSNSGEDVLSLPYALSRQDSSSSGYRVIAEYIEDFRGSSPIESFFSYSGGAMESGRYCLASGSCDDEYEYISGSGSLSFTIPESSSGLLSFDYVCGNGSVYKGRLSEYFTLKKDGGSIEYWDEPFYNDGSGSYTHKKLLAPGTYTLTGGYGCYGKKCRAFCSIDNLSLLLLEAWDEGSYSPYISVNRGDEPSEDFDSAGIQNGMVRHKGSFTVPCASASYGLCDVEYSSGFDISYASLVTGSKSNSLSFTVPSGKKALFVRTGIESSPPGARCKHKSKNKYMTFWGNATFSWGSDTWINYAEPGISQRTSDIPEKYNISAKNLTGSHNITSDFYYYREASSVYYAAEGYGKGDFTSFELYLCDESKTLSQALSAGNFFEENAKVYSKDMEYDGSLKIRLSGGDSIRISGFRLYYIEDGEKIYVENSIFSEEEELNGWSAADSQACISALAKEKDEVPELVYEKNEYVNYDISYGDYENDPASLYSFTYYHSPYNDGLWSLSGTELNEAVHSFDKDGKYVLYVKAKDDSARDDTRAEGMQDGEASAAVYPGDYDRFSEPYKITFYIKSSTKSGSTNNPPYIKKIWTEPEKPKEGEDFNIFVQVGDKDGDTLTLDTEIYLNGAGDPVAADTDRILEASSDGGSFSYKEVEISIKKAKAGVYEAVSVVRDQSGVDIGNLRFTIEVEKSLIGWVNHTDLWDEHRSEMGITDSAVFLEGEAMVLKALAEGKPTRVDAYLNEAPVIGLKLNAAGNGYYTGKLTDAAKYSYSSGGRLTVRFEATYEDGTVLLYDVPVYIDKKSVFWRLHRIM